MEDSSQQRHVSCCSAFSSVYPNNKRSTTKNSEASPLLRFPPEIRNRIYEYVLGGNTVHMIMTPERQIEPSRLTHRLCKLGDKDQAEYPRCSLVSKMDRIVWPNTGTAYHQRHIAPGCHLTTDQPRGYGFRLSLSLLKSCRQIHKEAALLPFIHNTFTCTGDQGLEVFIDKLFPVQRRALHRLIVISKGLISLRSIDRLARLTHLTALECHVDLFGTKDIDLLCGRLHGTLLELPLKSLDIRIAGRCGRKGYSADRVASIVEDFEKNILSRSEDGKVK